MNLENDEYPCKSVSETQESAGSSSKVVSFIPSPLQARILEITRDVMKKHYILDCDELHSHCIRILKNEDSDTIKKNIDLLVEKHVITDGRALTLDNVLENKNRNRILSTIQRLPGLNQSKIKQLVDINFGTIKWHLAILVKFGLIKPWTIDKQITYFPPEVDEKYFKLYYTLNKRNMADILNQIDSTGALTENDIAKQLSYVPRTTLARKLTDLVDAGIINSCKNESLTIYKILDQVSPLIRTWLKQNATY